LPGRISFGDLAKSNRLRDTTTGLRIGIRRSGPQTTGQVAAFAQRRDLAGTHAETRTGVEVALERRSATGLSAFGRAGWTKIDNRLNDGLAGDSLELRLGISRSLAGRATVGTAVFGERRSAERTLEEYRRLGLSVFGSVEPGFGLIVDASAYAAVRDFTSPNPLFVDDPDEVEYGAMIRVEKSDLFLANRFVPYVEVKAARVNSGIDAFSYTETRTAIGVRKAF
jgi:outer membrane protein